MSSSALDETIAAIASAAGRSARGIVRMSGPCALDLVMGLLEDPGLAATIPRDKSSTWSTCLALPEWGRIPVSLYLWPTCRSYTRQPTVELHAMGSPPLLDVIIDALCRRGARLARPGEFTLRAFLAGRLDLTQAEAVLGVIQAPTEHALQHALQQLAGGLADPLQQVRSDLLNLCADLEAGLDFVDEDITFIDAVELMRRLAAAREQLREVLQQLIDRGVDHEVPRVVLWGRPNVGKSSLFNTLACCGASIVSDEAGTTRDYVVRRMEWQQAVFDLVDTAGIDVAAPRGTPAGMAHQVTEQALRSAHVRLLCLERGDPMISEMEDLPPVWSGGPGDLIVWTKCDQPSSESTGPAGLRTSSRQGTGIHELLTAIVARLTEMERDAVTASTAFRCADALQRAGERIASAELLAGGAASAHMPAEELVAAELRMALTELGEVVGAIYTNDLLDRIFSRFCIGK